MEKLIWRRPREICSFLLGSTWYIHTKRTVAEFEQGSNTDLMAKAPWHAVCQRAFLIPSNFKLTYYLKSYLGGLVLFALLLVRYSSFHSLFHSVNRLVDTV